MAEGAVRERDGLAAEDAFLETVAREIRRQAEAGCESLCIDILLEVAPWGRRQTERLFRERYLTSPARYFRDCQWEQAERLLKDGKDVLSAAVESGFASTGRLHEAVLLRRGMTPGEVRRRGEGVRIAYAFFETPLGVALLAATPRGLCALRLFRLTEGAEDGDAALADVQGDFPRATFAEDAAAVQPYADQLVAFLERRADSFRPRLDLLRGTTFQREVWAELQRIKPGETISYRELAARVGRPAAVRAAASACAANHIAIAIPCHRVIRSDGGLSDFRWGSGWKRHLLDLESQMAEAAAG